MEDWRDHYPKIITRASMFERYEDLAARTLRDGHPVVVDSLAGEVVLMSAAKYRSIMETVHVFSSRANALRLTESLERADRCETVAVEFDGAGRLVPTEEL